MKGRLIKDKEQRIIYLHQDGSIIPATNDFMRFFISNFKSLCSTTPPPGQTYERWLSDSCLSMHSYEGETLAYLTNNDELVVSSPEAFCMLEFNSDLDSYISLPEYAKKWNKSIEIIKVLCRNKRIPGAVLKFNRWLIPKDAVYPVDPIRQRS